MLNTKLRRTSLAILAVVLMLSVFAMTAFAEETDGLLISPNPNADEAVSAEAPAEDGAVLDDGSDIADAEDTEAVADEAEAEADAAEEDKATEEYSSADAGDTDTVGATDDGHDHDHEEEEGFTTSDLILLIIFAVVVIVVAVVCVIKREKVGKYFRGIKSEFKKIVWSPWNQVRKNSIVVIVVVIALAVVIGLLDFLFGNGITELKNLINP